ncbi:MAG UNVERIFIED_CONTAM: hypothetical protein LVR18_21900 [Planctomycetaceae bacterium]
MNILFLGAHHDDLEVSIGGSVARWTAEGHRVVSAILTDSIWTAPGVLCIGQPPTLKDTRPQLLLCWATRLSA